MSTRQHIVIYGNSGSGKTTLANAIAKTHNLTHIDLDDVAWKPDIWAERLPIDQSIAQLTALLDHAVGWVVEGCYANLITPILNRCTLLYFLNPGIDACIQNCRTRNQTLRRQNTERGQKEQLDQLIDWVSQYETRPDEFGLNHHTTLFNNFTGPKQQLTSMQQISNAIPHQQKRPD